jgi:hypothetical protein
MTPVLSAGITKITVSIQKRIVRLILQATVPAVCPTDKKIYNGTLQWEINQEHEEENYVQGHFDILKR